jgi:uncharacterized protein (DUF433 family)
MEELVQDLKSLNATELQEVATYVAFLKFRARGTQPPGLPAAIDLEPLYAGFAAEERQPAENQVWLGIEKAPDVVGGDAYIAHTHIPVWTLESYRRLGWTEAQLLTNFPTLRAVDLVYAWAYVAAQPAEIEQALRAQEEACVI